MDNSFIPELKEKKTIQPSTKNDRNSETKKEPVESENVKKKQSKFEVFKPGKAKLRTHTPRTIISNISKESGKKK